ncbi:MAG: DNA polymerase III subunit beta [Candidatus Nanopusillus acidilobi]
MAKVSVKQLKDAINQSLSSKAFPNVLLKTTENTLKISSMDDDSYFSTRIGIIEKDTDLIALVDRKHLLNLLKTIKSEQITLLVQNEELLINTDKAVYRLQSLDPDRFNTYGLDKDIDIGIMLPSKAVIDAIDRVIYAASKDRYEYLKSVGFIFENGSFFVASTDGDRLAMCDLKMPNIMNNRYGIPKSVALHLKKLLKKDVLFGVVKNNSYEVGVFKGENFILATRLTDGYPDIIGAVNGYKEYITIEVKLSKSAMLDILQTFVVDKRNTNAVKLTISNNNLNITSLANNSQANISIDYKGNEYTINFNALYLLEAIDNINNDEIILKLPSRNDYAAYVEPVNGCDCLALVMPMA